MADLIGKDFTPPDVRAKVTGAARYAEDFRMDGMLHCRLLKSPMPHAIVRSIDARRALELPGVVAILTADEVPEQRSPANNILTNEPHFIDGEDGLVGGDETEPVDPRDVNSGDHRGDTRERQRRGRVDREQPSPRVRRPQRHRPQLTLDTSIGGELESSVHLGATVWSEHRFTKAPGDGRYFGAFRGDGGAHR